ncbi:chitobiase/beta-hexosaminidase C-terminal domain-containing protein [Agromyces sp. NPDC058064]|uniref:chitobiase/beta-hexosaminidase C-terminal domain-containing protein n=1 Tax=Agromyces sp. NPDC058064 TaxID=3346322 RepID=UPI0036DE9561
MPAKRTFATACALTAGALLAAGLPVGAAMAAPKPLDAPVFSEPGGRYTGSTTVELSSQPGTKIHYTLDGSTPTKDSPQYRGPITIDESTNLAAIAVRGRFVSETEIEGYVVKSAEGPKLSFVVMSDVHTSSLSDVNRARWAANFDTLKTLVPDPDLIISNGDQINDNNWNTAPDHQVVRTIFEENLDRLDLADTPVLMTHGNHDVRNSDMAQYYPADWFPGGATGYYEQKIGDSTFLIVDTEAYSGAQRTWLKSRLAALTAEPGAVDEPVFVVGHRPTSGTIMDGAQSSNPALNADLSAFPQAVYFSGHSHLHLNDERSIWQGSYTAVNDGSMSYTETPHDAYQVYGDALYDEFTIATAQALVVDVYDDRTEIERINFAAEPERTYTLDGVWGQYQQDAPFDSAGTLAGRTWTVRLDGATPEEVRANFDYTRDARDAVAPVMTGTPTVTVNGAGTSVLRVPAASDDNAVYGYDVRVKDAATGAVALPIRAGAKVLSDFQFAPRPSVLEIPLAVINGRLPGTKVGLTTGTAYVAEVTAVDMVGNRSETVTVEFVAGVAPDEED